jgi:hypothetical protein
VGADAAPSISVLALALAHAARAADFDVYHHAVFETMHGEERKVGEEDLIAIAAEAGVDAGRFTSERARWMASVGDEHNGAVERFGVYGTPTLIFDATGAYVRLTEPPASDEESLVVLDSLAGVAAAPVNLVEVFLPEGPKPTPVQLGLTTDAPFTGR